MSSSVYLVQETGKHNFAPALEFGEIQVLLPPTYQISFDAKWAIEQIHQGLNEIKQGDYILLSGDPSLIGLTVAIASKYLNGEVNLLKWDRQEKIYIPINCSLYGD
tara:strand:+ start:404 stop:721 length:318 start_codon:yes stop_codon:yes gene_type:complete